MSIVRLLTQQGRQNNLHLIDYRSCLKETINIFFLFFRSLPSATAKNKHYQVSCPPRATSHPQRCKNLRGRQLQKLQKGYRNRKGVLRESSINPVISCCSNLFFIFSLFFLSSLLPLPPSILHLGGYGYCLFRSLLLLLCCPLFYFFLVPWLVYSPWLDPLFIFFPPFFVCYL